MAMEPKVTTTKEPDEEGLNWTQNPMENNEILLAYIKEVQKPNEIWINTKTSNAIEFHLKHNKKKETHPSKQLVLEALHDYLMSLMKFRLIDSLDPTHGIIKLN